MLAKTNTLLLTALLAAIGSAAPPCNGGGGQNGTAPVETAPAITPEQIEKIAPKSVSCDDAEEKDECATSDVAARALAASFEQYGVSSVAEQAAVIGLLAFECDEFQFSRNHNPGVPGQGTRNMQSPDFNAEYAESIEEISDEVAEADGDVVKILDLLLSDEEYDFGSGAWFLTTQCDEAVREQLQSGSEEGWAAYITECVGTEANEDRKGYWETAVEAL